MRSPMCYKQSRFNLTCLIVRISGFHEVFFHLLKFFFIYFSFCISLFKNIKSTLFFLSLLRTPGYYFNEINDSQNKQDPKENHEKPSKPKSHSPSIIPMHIASFMILFYKVTA